MDALATLPLEAITPGTGVRWFAPFCGVIDRGPMCEVMAGGLLVGQFERDGRDRGQRNILLVQLAQDPTMHLGRALRDPRRDLLAEMRRVAVTATAAAAEPGQGALDGSEIVHGEPRSGAGQAAGVTTGQPEVLPTSCWCSWRRIRRCTWAAWPRRWGRRGVPAAPAAEVGGRWPQRRCCCAARVARSGSRFASGLVCAGGSPKARIHPTEAWRRQPKHRRLSVATVQREQVRWREELKQAQAQPTVVVEAPPAAPTQLGLFTASESDVALSDDGAAVDESVGAVRPATSAPIRPGATCSTSAAG